MQTWFDGLHPIVVVEHQDEMIARASLSSYRPRTCYAGIVECAVYVRRDWRGKGTVVARNAGQVVGCAALEIYETAALLRSVAVASDARECGLGQQLVEEQLQEARRRGIQNVYLLTETAQDSFPRFGFHPIDRAAVAQAIHASVEWTSACPETAQAMVFSINEGVGTERASFWP